MKNVIPSIILVTGIPRNDKNQAELQTQNQGSKGTVKESKIDANVSIKLIEAKNTIVELL